jgi:hypothetical protein
MANVLDAILKPSKTATLAPTRVSEDKIEELETPAPSEICEGKVDELKMTSDEANLPDYAKVGPSTTRATGIFGGQELPKIRPLPPKISYFRRP